MTTSDSNEYYVLAPESEGQQDALRLLQTIGNIQDVFENWGGVVKATHEYLYETPPLPPNDVITQPHRLKALPAK